MEIGLADFESGLPFLLTVGRVLGFAVPLPTLPQRPDNINPAVGEGAVSARQAVPTSGLTVAVSPCPGTVAHALPGKIVHRLAEGMGTGAPEFKRPLGSGKTPPLGGLRMRFEERYQVVFQLAAEWGAVGTAAGSALGPGQCSPPVRRWR